MARVSMVPITVDAVERVARRVARIDFTGMTAIESVLPASFLSLSFSEPVERGASERRGRSDRRTFTPRAMSAIRETLTVEFVLHGEGPASTWAEAATIGDTIWAGPTKGGYRVPPAGSHLVLIGDETAIPAIGTIIEAVDPSVRTVVILEVIDQDDERDVASGRGVDPMWLHRGDDPARTGMLTTNLVEELSVPDGTYWWIGGEREAILTMRDLLVNDRGVSREQVDLNAHWRLRPVDPRST